MYAGGISLQDMQNNINDTDNNAVSTPNFVGSYTTPDLTNPFLV